MIFFNDVSFHYGGEHGTGEGVDNIKLHIKKGELVVLCGRSGCGKTTITRLINGLVPNFYTGDMEGSITIDNINITEQELAKTSTLVGSVFQNPKSQFFNMNTTSELAFGCENQGIEREEIKKRIEKTTYDMNISSLINRNIFHLSGGEKQQIACGSVYTTSPPVFVLDEPSSNLDKKAIKSLHDVIKKLKDDGKTIVISEHRLYYLMDLADKFIYLEDGIITNTFTSCEMKELSDEQLQRLGLRCTNIENIKKSKYNKSDFSKSKKAIEATDLVCNRGSEQILNIERINIPQGSIVAMIGDNGCGKSTLCESLCGVIACNGAVSFNGQYLSSQDRTKQSFLVMQDVNRQLFSESVLEEVRLNTNITEEEAVIILSKLDLELEMYRHPSSLSGGQKQRVAIASALCAKKQIIFYDEPTSGLDRGGMERFSTLLRNNKNSNLSSIIITHDIELIFSCCTHILHVDNGRVLGFYELNEEGEKRVRKYFSTDSENTTTKKRKNIGSIERILSYAGKYKKYTYSSIFILAIGALFSVLPFFCIYTLLNKFLSGATVTLQSSFIIIGTVLLSEILYAIFYIKGLSMSHKSAYYTLENIRCSLQEKLEKQPMGNITEMGKGSVKKLFTDDIESIELLLAHMMPEGLANLIIVLVVLIFLIIIDWQCALLTILMISFGFIASKKMYTIGIGKMGDYFNSAKKLNNTIIEYVNGMQEVKVFGLEGQSGEKFKDASYKYRNFTLDWFNVCWPWMALYGTMFSYLTLYTLPFGAFFVLSGTLTISKYILVLCMSFAVGPLITHIMSFVSSIPQINYKIQAVEKSLDKKTLKCGKESFKGTNYDVTFNNVYFSYKTDTVLNDISFRAKSGEMTAIVGSSGSGKSTIAKLIAHYYDVNQGSVCFGNQDISKMSESSHRKLITYVSQDLFLYDTTILENIRIGDPMAPDEQVKMAARKANCEEFILNLPNGYNTEVGLSGNKLSIGQKQRISFARSILKDSPIIVLDEATAYLDVENEEKMNDAIKQIIKEKTVIVIAHKLSSIINADKIIVLNEGKIIKEGTHQELLKCEEYKKLVTVSSASDNWVLKKEGEE